MPDTESTTNYQAIEPEQVLHIRKHASYLLVGRLANRLYETVWFTLGLMCNVAIMMPYFILLALVLARYHFLIIDNWLWAMQVGALVVFILALVITPVLKRRRSNEWIKKKVPALLGNLILALGVCAVLLSTNLAVEYLRDRFRFNELTLSKALAGTGTILAGWGLLQRAVPRIVRKNKQLHMVVVGLSGAIAIFLVLVLLVNWLVYGNTLEFATLLDYVTEWTFFTIALVAISVICAIIASGWISRNWSVFFRLIRGLPGCKPRLCGPGNLLSYDNCIYILPIIVLCCCFFPYEKWSTSLKQDTDAISFGIGPYSRALGVFASIDPSEYGQLSESTRKTIASLQKQREGIRWRQEYTTREQGEGLSNLNSAHVATFGATQSYVDDAVELYEVEQAERFLLRQAVAERSRKLLLQRANLANGQINIELTPRHRWRLAKQVLLEQTTLNILAATNDPLFWQNPVLEEIEKRLILRLLELKVNALYQKEFLTLFCPQLSERVPQPFSITSSFPGTLPLFFDGINREEILFIRVGILRFIRRSDGDKSLLEVVGRKLPKGMAETIEAEEEVRKSKQKSTDMELLEDCVSNTVRFSTVETARESSETESSSLRQGSAFNQSLPLTKGPSDGRGGTWCLFPEPVIGESAMQERPSGIIVGNVAREMLIERALMFGSPSIEALQSIQSPQLLLSDADKEKREKYASRGREHFAPKHLILISVAPFVGDGIQSEMKSQVTRCHQIDLVASTVAFSEFANLEKMSTLRHEVFAQNFGLKAFFISIAALIVGAIAVGWLNVNWTTANEYYREKLSQAFLVSERGDSLDVRLSELNRPECGAPFLLINAVANLQGSDNLSLRDRKCDMFLFSPQVVGCRQTGYMKVRDFEKADPRFKLSTAVAISAAAVGPNMGRYTPPALVWLLTLLNVRLGYWVPNPYHLQRGNCDTQAEIKNREVNEYLIPRRGVEWDTLTELDLIGLAFPGGGIRSASFNLGVAQALDDFHLLSAFDYLSTVSGGGYIGASLVARMHSRRSSGQETKVVEDIEGLRSESDYPWYPPPFLLVREMFSLLSEKNMWLNLSDGGHAENLAVFELLQRECKLILVGNAEAGITNPNNGLGILARLAKTELDIDILLDTSGFELDKNLHSREHWAVGRIHYPSGLKGMIVVLRASMTGDESVAITEYKERCRMFPFESTTDQFFDVDQFEAYRSLGEHVARDFLAAVFPDVAPTDHDTVSVRCKGLVEAVSSVLANQSPRVGSFE